MKYPDNERILIVRPCLKAICLGVRSASKLLSVMLYRARNCAEKETTFTFTCNQDDLVHDLCEELTTKQIHDMAIPVLQLLGYLEVDGSGFRHIYTVHLDKVQLALSCYKNTEELELLLISFIYKQLEEVPMELELVPIQLEEVLKHLELLLKQIRTSSNSKRGRKPRREALLEAHSENADSNRESRDITDKERAASSDALTPADFLPDEHIVFEHNAGNETLYYHSACVQGHYGTSEGMVLTVVSLEQIVQEARCGMCQSNIHLAPFDTHSHSGHNAWNCEAWRNAHDGASCADYQTYIDSGQREETPTEPRITAVNTSSTSEIGATNGTTPTGDHRTLPVRKHHDQTADHPAQAQIAIASTSGGTAFPPAAAVRQSHTSLSVQGPDGAVADEGSRPRASGKRKGKKVTQEADPIPQEALRIMDDWDTLQKKPVPRTERLIAAASALVCRNPTREELKDCRNWLPTTDRPGKPWYRLHGVGLWDIAEKIGQWDSLEGMSIEPAPLADMKQPGPMDIYTQASLDPERTERNLAKLRAKRLAREAAAQQQGGAS